MQTGASFSSMPPLPASAPVQPPPPDSVPPPTDKVNSGVIGVLNILWILLVLY